MDASKISIRRFVITAFNQEKALVGAFSVIVQPVVEPMDHYTALIRYLPCLPQLLQARDGPRRGGGSVRGAQPPARQAAADPPGRHQRHQQVRHNTYMSHTSQILTYISCYTKNLFSSSLKRSNSFLMLHENTHKAPTQTSLHIS